MLPAKLGISKCMLLDFIYFLKSVSFFVLHFFYKVCVLVNMVDVPVVVCLPHFEEQYSRAVTFRLCSMELLGSVGNSGVP
jgi:hypothetical protein